MNVPRVVSGIVAVAVLALISAVLLGSVAAASTSTLSAPASAGHDSPVPTPATGTAVPSAKTETSRPVTETEALSAGSNTTVIGTSPLPATETPTDTSASTTTTEATPTPTPTSTDATSGVTNTTENTTETVTNTTDAVTNTTENTTSTVANTTGDAVENATSSATNSTGYVTSTLTNATENTTSSVTTTSPITNTTGAVVSTATNRSGNAETEAVNLTVNASVATNGTLEIAASGGGTATAGSSGTTPGSKAHGAGDGVGTETGTDAGAVAARAEDPDQSNSTPPGVPRGSGAALGGLLVVGVTLAAASRQIATTTAASQGRELAWAGRIARGHVAHTASSVRSDLARFPRLLVPLGYSRHDDSDPLEHEVRQALFEAIERSPGANLSSLADRSDVSMSTVRHHLRILEEENLVASERIRGKRRYFLRNESRPALVAALDDPATGSILQTLARTGPASVSDLAADLGRDPSTISHHVSRLEDDGLVARERDGRTVQNSLGPIARRVLTQETSAQQRPVATE